MGLLTKAAAVLGMAVIEDKMDHKGWKKWYISEYKPLLKKRVYSIQTGLGSEVAQIKEEKGVLVVTENNNKQKYSLGTVSENRQSGFRILISDHHKTNVVNIKPKNSDDTVSKFMNKMNSIFGDGETSDNNTSQNSEKWEYVHSFMGGPLEIQYYGENVMTVKETLNGKCVYFSPAVPSKLAIAVLLRCHLNKIELENRTFDR